MVFQRKNLSMTDLDLVLNSFELRVLAQWLVHKAWKGKVPGSSHNRWIVFLVFAVQQTSNIYDNREVQFLKKKKCRTSLYRRIGLSGTHHYLAHTAYWVHAVFLTKSVQTLDMKYTTLMDHFQRYITRMRMFGYYSLNPAWGGNSFSLTYCVYGKIHTVYYSSACSSTVVATTCKRLTRLIVRRVCFLLAFVALPYNFPRPS